MEYNNMFRADFEAGYWIELVKDSISGLYLIHGSLGLSNLPISINNLYVAIKKYHKVKLSLNKDMKLLNEYHSNSFLSKKGKYAIIKSLEVIEGNEIYEFTKIEDLIIFINK